MNIEGSSSIQRRAAKHAALSDPARLRIVDTLGFGDASPTELQEMLAMPSNLLAHHLRVLEGVGILRRVRSEADRRRTYVQLIEESLDGLSPASVVRAGRVVFVCTANSARSQLAAALWRRSSAVPVTSAGTHPAPRIDPAALDAARRHTLPLRVVRPRGLEGVLHEGDYVVTVCDNAHEELASAVPSVHWSIPDPVRLSTDAAYDDVYDQLARRISNLAPRVSAS
ncbi:MAG: ArsR family transcriptional regulator, arsenate/arsenite/antimonite-responsive transcriptional [Pseudonocardiales bacterium]|jgi:protein-tyrosine-phosphatase/DNA-binding HxlR family transcriptional regulator|nr:ArsR family transcriptional regulator, arsenate/arsenite/antimonite-responsive transcriptional [Pseudonocardiales bacterium]